MRFASLLFAIAFLWNGAAFAQNEVKVIEGHVHEAFMNVEAPVTLLTTVTEQPPAPMQETQPPQKDPQTVWVPGYWEWSHERSEFIWCSGNWRRPPPGRQWIGGSWQKVDGGWVRVKGFWSDIPEAQLVYITKTPPDAFNETPQNQPGDNYFWMAGYWKFENNKYVWYTGKWEKLDQNWIYVPARYVWRPQGYVFVSAFWDWPLDQRGTAYACVAVPRDQSTIVYTPEMIVEPITLIQGCLLYYPDYTYFYFYYYHFYIDWWWGCAWCPPWWGWGWWWMPWWDHWGLWWWWVHPGFPAPWWLEDAILDILEGPPLPLIHEMEEVHPPVIVGPDGVIPPGTLIDEGGGTPVFPEDPTDLQEDAGKGLEEGTTDRPQGPTTPHDELGNNPPTPPHTTPPPPAGANPGTQPPTPPTPPRVPPSPQVPTPERPPVTPPVTPPQTPGVTPPTYTPPPRPPTPPTYPPQGGGNITPPTYPPQGGTIMPPNNYPPPRPPGVNPPTPPRPTPPSGPNVTPPGNYPPPRPTPPTRPPVTPPSTTRPPTYNPPTKPNYPSQSTPTYPSTPNYPSQGGGNRTPSTGPQYNPSNRAPQYVPQSPNFTPQNIPQSPQGRQQGGGKSGN